ncbi:unnamed protein product [Caenorhabditis auriculariae]|uniref:F-box domain-containing protein n=1 Tax=Caenorhabditis auriculariae TaxID=2777116 RepID=A0A8S1GPG3_9PELO|nr:unnamed protein product [Caenorhabditis auriculariae]
MTLFTRGLFPPLLLQGSSVVQFFTNHFTCEKFEKVHSSKALFFFLMISVTVAANGRSRRVIGANLKAYGSGRLLICELDKETLINSPNVVSRKNKVRKVLEKVVEWVSLLIRPSAFSRKIPISSFSSSPIQKLTDDLLLNIFSKFDAESVISCELVCRRWSGIINENLNELPKKFLRIRFALYLTKEKL